MPRPHLPEQAVRFPAADDPPIRLHGQWSEAPSGGAARAVVVCHPHPLYGGNLLNHVVARLVETAREAGWATLRFNFRGVGLSEGKHAEGIGEMDDVRGALAFVRSKGAERIVLIGYSFGSAVGLGVALGTGGAGLAGFVSVASPALKYVPDLAPGATALPCPALFVAGSEDQLAGTDELKRKLGRDSRTAWVTLPGVEHFFKTHEAGVALQKEVAEFLGRSAGPPP